MIYASNGHYCFRFSVYDATHPGLVYHAQSLKITKNH